MGQLEKAKAERKGTARGQVDNGKRLAQLGSGNAPGGADWGNVDPAWLAAVIILMAGHGGAVRFGYSRDKGSYSLGLYLGQETQTLWYNGSSDIQQELQNLYAELEVKLGE